LDGPVRAHPRVDRIRRLAQDHRDTMPDDRAPTRRRAPYGPGWIRTSDLGIKSPLLCQLSYRPAETSVAAGGRYPSRAAPID